jgi:hypothetical protein
VLKVLRGLKRLNWPYKGRIRGGGIVVEVMMSSQQFNDLVNSKGERGMTHKL